jgi:hypothetical protein
MYTRWSFFVYREGQLPSPPVVAEVSILSSRRRDEIELATRTPARLSPVSMSAW